MTLEFGNSILPQALPIGALNNHNIPVPTSLYNPPQITNNYAHFPLIAPLNQPALPSPSFQYSNIVGLTMLFQNTSLNAVSYLWNFGDGTTSVQKNPAHTFPSSASYVVKLRAFNKVGAYQDNIVVVTVNNVAPAANFTSVVEGHAASFTNTSTIETNGSHWDFGDGTTSTLDNPYHLYASSGTYTVTLTVSGYTKTATITTADPVADSYAFQFKTGVGVVSNPYGSVVDSSKIYVANYSANEVKILDRATGALLNTISAGAYITNLYDVAEDATQLYLAGGGGVAIYNNATYTYVDTFTGGGAIGTATGVAVDASYIYVADRSNHRVAILNKTTGALITTFGSAGSGDGQFQITGALAIDASYIYVAENAINSRLQIFDIVTHTYVATISDGADMYGVDVDSKFIYITESSSRVALYDVVTLGFVSAYGSNGTGDGQFGIQPSGVSVYNNMLYVSDTNNNRVEVVQHTPAVVTINDRPTALFSVDHSSGTTPLTVNFTDQSSNTPTSWLWEFENGSTSTSQNPSHTFTSSGVYQVRLTATNAAGSNTYTMSIVVNDPSQQLSVVAPVASFTADNYTGTAGLVVNFTDTSTGSPESWVWSVDGVAFSTAQNPSYTFSANGSYVVQLTVTKGVLTSKFTRMIVVAAGPYPPVVTTFSSTGNAGSAPFNATFTIATSGSPTSYAWDFGDGGVSTLQNPTHIYANPGIYTASVTVTNANGSTTSSMKIVVSQVSVVAPDAHVYLSSSLIGYFMVDSLNDRILIYEQDGTFISEFGSIGSGNGQFNNPTCMAIAGATQMLNRIQT